jgi:hypothetical protein
MRGLASLLLAFLVSCGTPTAVDSGLLRVSARNSSVTLSNHSAQPVSYIIATPSFLELADPVPCAQPGGCQTSVPANGTITVPYGKIWGYGPGERRAVVVHWRGLDGTVVDSVRRLVVTLR